MEHTMTQPPQAPPLEQGLSPVEQEYLQVLKEIPPPEDPPPSEEEGPWEPESIRQARTAWERSDLHAEQHARAMRELAQACGVFRDSPVGRAGHHARWDATGRCLAPRAPGKSTCAIHAEVLKQMDPATKASQSAQAGVDEMMKPLRTKTGRVVTQEDMEALADEAEQGYDVSHLKQGTTPGRRSSENPAKQDLSSWPMSKSKQAATQQEIQRTHFWGDGCEGHSLGLADHPYDRGKVLVGTLIDALNHDRYDQARDIANQLADIAYAPGDARPYAFGAPRNPKDDKKPAEVPEEYYGSLEAPDEGKKTDDPTALLPEAYGPVTIGSLEAPDDLDEARRLCGLAMQRLNDPGDDVEAAMDWAATRAILSRALATQDIARSLRILAGRGGQS